MSELGSRQLAAVMFCDMVGFTAAMQEDEQSALESRDRYRNVIEHLHDEFGGQVVQYYGDGTLSIFGNSADAVRCAVAIQQTLRQDPVVPARVGLHVGDVVVEEHGLLGDAVNVASRIESFGQPGAVLVSDSVHDLVKNQPNLTLVSLGEFHLENVARPFGIFAVETDGLVVPDADALIGKGRRVADRASLSNLPAQVTSFVGRVQESAEVIELIGRSRLVTLTGVGGVGKTRLSLQVAAKLMDEYADGVWLVELASLRDPTLVVRQTADPFGVRDMKTGRMLEDVLADYLAGAQLLLVLDNCEHVVESCAALTELLLTRCANLKIIATSRELLGVPGEVVYPVPPLKTATYEMAETETDAVLLFADRAAQAQLGFRLSPETTSIVREIANRLEGLPLAIELAASRANLLTPDQMLHHLDDHFRLLTSSRRDRGRHTTLNSAMDWSYDLLSGDEQSLFRQLAVFNGGWSLEAVERVCEVQAADPLDLLGRLVDQSLVDVSQAAGTNRYRLLEPVRHYALEKCREKAEESMARRRHAEYFVGLAEAADLGLRGHRQDDWARRVELEHDNARGAIEWSLEAGLDGIALRLAAAMAWFWWVGGYWREAQDWFHRVDDATHDADPVLRGRLVYKLAALEIQRSRPTEVMPLLEQTLPVLKERGSEADVAWVMAQLADGSSESERGLELANESIRRFAAIGDTWGEAYVRMTLGYNRARDDAQRNADMSEAIDALSALGDRWTAAWFAFNFGYSLSIEGRYDQGRRVIEQTLEAMAAKYDRWVIAHCKHRLAAIATMTGNHQDAKRLFEEALPVHRKIGDENCTASGLMYLGEVLGDEGRHAAARSLLEQALEGARDLQNPSMVASCLRRMGWLAAAEGDHRRAARLLGASHTLRREVGGVISQHDRQRTTEVTEEAKASMGPGPFDEWWNSGSGMDMDEAVDFALNRLDDV